MEYEIQIRWGGRWLTVQRGFKTRGAAELVATEWRQDNDCYGDPFRAVEVGSGPPVAAGVLCRCGEGVRTCPMHGKRPALTPCLQCEKPTEDIYCSRACELASAREDHPSLTAAERNRGAAPY